MAPRDFDALFAAVADLARDAGARLLVNSRHDRRYWRVAGDKTGGGVHLTGRDLVQHAQAGARPDLPLVAASCHGSADLAVAGRLGVDLAVLGPVERTASHPDGLPLGWPGFEQAIGLTPVPVYALGGLTAGDVEEAMRRGAHGIAFQRAAWAA
jgi:8-oxo-dGTP diphosphatase